MFVAMKAMSTGIMGMPPLAAPERLKIRWLRISLDMVVQSLDNMLPMDLKDSCLLRLEAMSIRS